jgi:two-component system, cell cycle response regulator
MSLQRRLTLFFIGMVMVPLAAAGFFVRFVILEEAQRRAELSLEPALNAPVALLRARLDALDDVAGGVVASQSSAPSDGGRTAGLERVLQRALDRTRTADFFIATDGSQRPVASALQEGFFEPGFPTPMQRDVVAAATTGGPSTGFVARARPFSPAHPEVTTLLLGFWTDQSWLREASGEGVELSLVSGDRVIASTRAVGRRMPIESFGVPFEIEGVGTGEAKQLNRDVTVVAWTSTARIIEPARNVLLSLLGLLAVALAVVALLGYWLARVITQPLQELVRGAEAMEQGHFGHRIAIRSKDEVGQVAEAFNKMSDRLGDTISELSSSRDLLHRTVQRVGETLRSTHDRRSILDSILNTAADAVAADAGIMWTFTPNRGEIYPAISTTGEVDENAKVKVGAGAVGLVAERGTSIRRSSVEDDPIPAPSEPAFSFAMIVPLYNEDRIGHVLSLYRGDDKAPFTDGDLATVRFLADQGRVAIENVILHEEAQRLSITDGLTGVWNRRYFQMQFRSVLATATRFGRHFSLLMLDLDRFKNVNDTYGHQRGDAILIEFAKRLKEIVREVDTFARYGGEEFVCLLAETDFGGAVVTAEKILGEIRSGPFGGPGEEPISLTVSIGIASFPQHGDSHRTLVAAADQALYRAKQAGRDRLGVPEGPPPHLQVAK